jgi:pimeloyl-ACP methyl ester carboxylesterase
MRSTPNLEIVQANGIKHRIAVAGDGPLVVLVHGFPESWYSWRHQIAALAAAGYRAAAIDVRGYGGTDKPDAVEAYDMVSHAADVAGLIAALGAERAAVVGHDWGAPIAWHTALLHPHRVSAVAGLSVPFTGRGQAPFTEVLRHVYRDRFFYFLYFQAPGVAEAELEADVRGSLRRIYFTLSGDAPKGAWLKERPKDGGLLEGLIDPDVLPSWLGEDDLDTYTAEFERGGFRGPINRYRNSERDWQALAHLDDRDIEQPACFIAGTREAVLSYVPGVDLIEIMRKRVPDLRGCHLIHGAGHWIQQERPDQVNAALVAFLDDALAA